MTTGQYNIVMFAYNEEDNIAASVQSVFDCAGAALNKVYVIANGCSDRTVEVVTALKVTLEFDALQVVEIALGDKCNAWNTYIHEIADNVDTHFFIDADVNFSSGCFEAMHQQLSASGENTVAVAGMPLSGRNIAFYRELVIERSCFFGNLYGLRNSFLERIRQTGFRLPVGLNWIDSFLTKAVNTDLNFYQHNLPERTTWIEGVGYFFESLSVFKSKDIKLYLNRIARYELGKLQEVFLDELPPQEWPNTMQGINQSIAADFEQLTGSLSMFKRYLVKKRLNRLLAK